MDNWSGRSNCNDCVYVNNLAFSLRTLYNGICAINIKVKTKFYLNISILNE